MANPLKLIHSSHSGKIKKHEHTSYALLIFILLVLGIALVASTVYAADHPPPESSSISLTGTMPGEAPTVAATISSPKDKQRFMTSPITISGTCPEETLVEIFKNNIFAGSSLCTEAGVYSVDIDLLFGNNKLFARVYDALNQPGPDSNYVEVYYDAMPAQADPLNALSFDNNQLLLNTDSAFRGVFPKQELIVPIDIIGGSPPYAINIQWGDTNNKVVSRNDGSSFNVVHAYSKPGTYQISIQATDMVGRVAFLTVASIVNGQPSIINEDVAISESLGKKLLVLWPMYTGSVAVVISFLIGEKREKQILKKQGLLVTH